MSEFRAGDKVKCINNNSYLNPLTIGKIYQVIAIRSYSHNDNYISIECDDKVIGWSKIERFELVEKETFDKEEFAYKILELWKISANWPKAYEKVLDMLGYTIESKTDYSLVKKTGE